MAGAAEAECESGAAARTVGGPGARSEVVARVAVVARAAAVVARAAAVAHPVQAPARLVRVMAHQGRVAARLPPAPDPYRVQPAAVLPCLEPLAVRRPADRLAGAAPRHQDRSAVQRRDRWAAPDQKDQKDHSVVRRQDRWAGPRQKDPSAAPHQQDQSGGRRRAAARCRRPAARPDSRAPPRSQAGRRIAGFPDLMGLPRSPLRWWIDSLRRLALTRRRLALTRRRRAPTGLTGCGKWLPS